MFAIEVNDLTKVYTYYNKEAGLKGSIHNLFHREKLYKDAIKNVFFKVKKGSITGLIGLNGAGKSTLIKMMCGILKPTDGEIKIMGHTPFEKDKDFLKKIAMVAGNRSQLWWDIPAIDSFELIKTIYEVPEQDYKRVIDEMSELLNVKHLLNIQLRRLSLGERMKMEIIASLVYSPEVLFLDEPTIGLDIKSQTIIRDFLKEYNRKNGTTIIITSHNFDDIDSLCNDLLIIDHGKLICDSTYNDFIQEHATVKILRLRFNDIQESQQKFLEKWNATQMDDEYQLFEIAVPNEENMLCLNEVMSQCGDLLKDISIQGTDLKDIIQKL